MGSVPDEFNFELGAGMEAALVLSLWLIMFAVALGLTPRSFAFFRDRPRIFLAGAFSQLIALPAVTVALCHLLSVSPSVGFGMILAACCPGGASSNLFTLFARGNTALSVALTATSSLAAAFVTPLSTLAWSQLYAPTADLLQRIDVDAVAFLFQTFLILALPVIVGMVVRHLAEDWAERWQTRVGAAGGLLLAAIVVINFVRFVEPFLALGATILLVVLAHNSLAFLTGYGLARLVRADEASRRCITIETGIQNTGLALVIIVGQFNGLGGAVAVIGLWGTWHLIGGGALVMWWRRKDARHSDQGRVAG